MTFALSHWMLANEYF
jgi:hypothetical protein